MIAFNLNGFQGRRSLGFLMIIFYFIYLMCTLLCELEVIHPYGTGHAHGDILDKHDDWIDEDSPIILWKIPLWEILIVFC